MASPEHARYFPWYTRLQNGLKGQKALFERLKPPRNLSVFFKTFSSVNNTGEAFDCVCLCRGFVKGGRASPWSGKDGAALSPPRLAPSSPFSSLLYLPLISPSYTRTTLPFLAPTGLLLPPAPLLWTPRASVCSPFPAPPCSPPMDTEDISVEGRGHPSLASLRFLQPSPFPQY